MLGCLCEGAVYITRRQCELPGHFLNILGCSMFWNPFRPHPAPPGFGVGTVLPEDNAKYVVRNRDQTLCNPDHIYSWVSRIIFYWVNPLLNVGFSRPLQEDGAWPFVCSNCERYLHFHRPLGAPTSPLDHTTHRSSGAQLLLKMSA